MGFVDYIAGALVVLVASGAIITSSRALGLRLVPGWSGPPLWIAVASIGSAIALLTALVLGTLGLLHGWIYLIALVGLAVVLRKWARPGSPDDLQTRPVGGSGEEAPGDGRPADVASDCHVEPASKNMTAVGLAIASLVGGLFAIGAWQTLGTGMTGFDSTWYHGPFAAGFAESGDTFSLQFLAPQFLSWFYPQNSELVHSLGILGLGNDLLSPLVNLGWLTGCLVAAWCIGRPYGAAPISLAGVALVLGSAAMADQAGEARNDIVGAFFVLASLAILINSTAGRRRTAAGPVFVVALTAGLAAGTKINFIPAAAVLAIGAVLLVEAGRRGRAALIAFGGLLAGGGYWYVRNLIQSGNPLPWVDGIGLPSPDQDLGGRDAASVISYVTDPEVIADWFLPGMADGFGEGWVVLVGLALLGMVLCLWRDSDSTRRVGAVAGMALLVAWIAAPTSASGPEGQPEGFVSGLRYLAPALAVGLALLGSAVGRRGRLARWSSMWALVLLAPFVVFEGRSWTALELVGAGLLAAGAFVAVLGFAWMGRSAWTRGRTVLAAGALLAVVVAGYAVQDRYFDNRYASPEFTTAGLSEAFVWARGVEGESIATNATRQYPLFGKELDNEVQYLGVPGPHGGFVRTDSCREFRDAVARGDYRYLVLTLDRENPDRAFPREIPWIEDDPNAVEVFRTSPTVVYELEGPLDPATCP